jgi:hypothetical protein
MDREKGSALSFSKESGGDGRDELRVLSFGGVRVSMSRRVEGDGGYVVMLFERVVVEAGDEAKL